jgi:glycerol-3-phosphate dehydrogenase
MVSEEPVDLLIIGGGINGAGIARDAAGRGLGVVLCEQDDLGGATSSASTKLIHGGLRYLEHYAFRLVRESLREREVLLRAAPHIIWPMRFVLPHEKGLRPAWLIRLGLFLYDHLGGRELLPGSTGIDLRHDPVGGPLAPDLHRGFVYSDCWVQDARLVVLNAIDAAERGAEVLPRTECLSARRVGGLWEAQLRDVTDGSTRRVRARAVVNAAGPWVSDVLEHRLDTAKRKPLRLIQGSHIVVRKLFDHDHAYIFQNPDRRIVFAIPYEQDFTLIGTTELDYVGDPRLVRISDAEIDYLCAAVSRYFVHKITPTDVVWSYSGVRPLFADAAESASAITRDYMLQLDAARDTPPLLNVFGGKITTYRRLAERALAKLGPRLGVGEGPWTAGAPLPGGDMPNADFDGFLARFASAHPWLPAALARRYARNYGTRAVALLEGAGSLDDLGADFGGGLYQAEVEYLIEHEWAASAEDILWRRSKLGLHVSRETVDRLQAWLVERGTMVDAKVAAR